MTLYHNGPGEGDVVPDDNAIIENNPDEYITRDDGRLIINCGEMPSARKLDSLLKCAASAVEASDTHELTQEPATKWIPPDER